MKFRNGVLGLALAGALVLPSCSTQEQIKVRRMEIGRPMLSGLKDGRYEGRYAYGSFEYAVEVGMTSGRLTDIKILANRDTSHARQAEAVLASIIAAQSPDVDAVTGATTTSKALMKAVENALTAAGSRP